MNIRVADMNTYEEELEAELATQIKVALVESGMDQKALAAAVGIESATLSRYMTGKKHMPMPTFFAVAGVLGVSPAALFARAEARVAR